MKETDIYFFKKHNLFFFFVIDFKEHNVSTMKRKTDYRIMKLYDV